MIFALVGNQNCGKTTLFNALTGSNQHVGNFPGVTVDQKMGEMRDEKGCSVVDLPGIYSLRPYTQEEIVSRDFIINEKPDGIINIVDATNIERNLYLTLQLLELRVPMVLALNMMDEVRANGGAIDVQKMSDALGIPVVPISAAKGEGVSELVDQALSVARSRTLPKVTDFCSDDSAVHRCIHAVVHIIADHADRIGVPARFCAAKLIEGGDDLAQVLDLDENERELLEHCIVQMENETGLDRNAALADMRYTFIEAVVAASVVKCHESKEHARSMKIDRILTGKYTAMPTFLLVMLLTFYLTFNVVGKWLSDLLQLGIDALTGVVDAALTAYGINPVVHSLIIDGVFAGVGSVLVFLPIIVTLFFFLSILEDTGYMARVAFVMDQLLRRIGEIAQATAAAFRGSAEVTELSSAPPLVNDPTLTNRAADLAADLFGTRMVYRLDEGGMGSEDFASYGYELPCAYLLLGAGAAQENPLYGKPMHNEAVVFNEDVLPRGAALHTWCAVNFLKAE